MSVFSLSAALIAATIIVGLVAYPHLPATVPMHWDAHGHVNGWGPRWLMLVLTPGIMTFIMLLWVALPWLSPQSFEMGKSQPAYQYMLLVIETLLAYVQVLILGAALGFHVDVGRAVVAGMCLMFMALGALMPKIHRNFYVGIRTPWTIASEPVWDATHRFAGKTFIAAGAIGLLLALSTPVVWAPIAVFVVAPLAPIVYSLVIYKREGQP